MTQYLPPNLLALFAARDPLPFLTPYDKLPHEKKRPAYIGLSGFLNNFEVILLLFLSAFPFDLWGYFFYVCGFFLLASFINFGIGLPTYFNNNSKFLSEPIIVGFNEIPSFVCWCTDIHPRGRVHTLDGVHIVHILPLCTGRGTHS